MQKYLVEFIGTFFLMLTVVLATNNPEVASLAPVAVGAMYMVMIYAGYHVSGAHYNPAISLAVFMRGDMEGREAGLYIFAQVAGAAAAAAIGAFLHSCGGEAVIRLHSNYDGVCSLLAEMLGAFAVAYVALNVSIAAGKDGSSNSYYGMAIGFSLTAASYGLGSVSGGAFNPAIAVGAAVAGMFATGDLWIYLVGALAGGAAAATVLSVIYRKEN